jgi:hypothetical protein
MKMLLGHTGCTGQAGRGGSHSAGKRASEEKRCRLRGGRMIRVRDSDGGRAT